MTFLDELSEACQRRGDHPYARHEGRVVTYRDLDRQTNRVANALRAAGVARGDRVTLALGNSIEWIVSAFAILRIGGILHPVNPGLGSSELHYLLGHSDPRLVIVDSKSASRIREGSDRSLAAFDAAAGADLRLDQAAAEASENPPDVEVRPEDGSTLLYTSGTTGNPKGVLFTHERTGSNGRYLVRGLRIAEDDTILFVGPLFHGNAWSGAMCAVQAGCTVAFPAEFHASRFWTLAHETGATVMFTLGTVLAILLQQPESELERTSSLRAILGLGSAPIREEIRRRFGIEHVVECFGSTDAGVVTLEPLDEPPRPGSAGPPLPGVDVRITDDQGTALARGEVGEITIRSPHRMASYFRAPEETDRAVRNGWFLTGDLGYVDDDGWLYFVDRKRDVIRRGGENISSVFVEKTLREHPAVVDVAVIGIPDPVLGQEVKAYVVAREPVPIDELERFAHERLAKFQVPRSWEFRDSLPKTPTQRVEKYKLREEAGGARKPLLG